MTSGGARRVVSLVPSDTFSVVRLGALDRLVGRTRYCTVPSEVAVVPSVGGTKRIGVQEVIALAPDLVLANREENDREDIMCLQRAGLDVMLMFPRTVVDGLDLLEDIAIRLGIDPGGNDVLARAGRLRALAADAPISPTAPRCFVPIWRDPWMTVNDDTYVGSVVRLLGLRNVFGQRRSHDEAGRDTRYPVVTIEEVVEEQPEVVLLPDEPYSFGAEHERELMELPIPAARGARVHGVDGKDLCWPGAWALEGLVRLRARLGAC